jgi:dTDP-glucose 4,6-dehydratase
MSILITGGAGFIGCNLIRLWRSTSTESLINVDCLAYAGNRANLADLGVSCTETSTIER